MYRTLILCSLPLTALVLIAADSAWKDKPVSQWTADDAKQILTDSPWVRQVIPQNVRDLSPDERREGGNMEASPGRGVGIAGLGILGRRRQEEAIARAHYKPTPAAVTVRWESAVPVRTAEQKTGETKVPTIDGDHYAVVVYDILTPKRWNLANELKGIAFLKRDTKKDIKPSMSRSCATTTEQPPSSICFRAPSRSPRKTEGSCSSRRSDGFSCLSFSTPSRCSSRANWNCSGGGG